jgi:Zn-finger nucleic acid-binding protein
MIKVNFAGVEVDRCTDCQGIFFDEFEKEQLQKMKGGDAVDIGDAKIGREFNRVDCINCPRCSSRMIRMVDLNQPHIWLEHCTVCGGSFFDAGEFRDLKHHTVVDFFKDLLVKERK